MIAPLLHRKTEIRNFDHIIFGHENIARWTKKGGAGET